MKKETFIGSKGKEIHYRYWLPENDHVIAVVHLFHGMAEHSLRYDEFARYLNKFSIAVYAQDHRGHGMNSEGSIAGWFASHKGWQVVVEDGYLLSQVIKERHSDVPLFLFGHSMGSFLVRSLLPLHHHLYHGAILSGTGSSQGIKGAAGSIVAALRSIVRGKDPDHMLDKLSFGHFNRPFEPARTAFDWLSKDEAKVDQYVEDPWCGYVCTSTFFRDLLKGVSLANNKRYASFIPKEFPLFIISGANDPVGDFGKGVEKVAKMYQKVGMMDVVLKLVKAGRHEILNETNRKEVYTDIGSWLRSHLS